MFWFMVNRLFNSLLLMSLSLALASKHTDIYAIRIVYLAAVLVEVPAKVTVLVTN